MCIILNDYGVVFAERFGNTLTNVSSIAGASLWIKSYLQLWDQSCIRMVVYVNKQRLLTIAITPTQFLWNQDSTKSLQCYSPFTSLNKHSYNNSCSKWIFLCLISIAEAMCDSVSCLRTLQLKVETKTEPLILPLDYDHSAGWTMTTPNGK